LAHLWNELQLLVDTVEAQESHPVCRLADIDRSPLELERRIARHDTKSLEAR
jgi:hypothetical protein